MDPIAVVTLQNALHITAAANSSDFDAAISKYLQQHSALLAECEGWQSWPEPRQTVLCLQLCCRQSGLNPGKLDGWWGPQTAYACSQLSVMQQSGKAPTHFGCYSPPGRKIQNLERVSPDFYCAHACDEWYCLLE